MAERIVDGNYNAFGVNKINDELVFTFEGEKEAKCAIRLYERKANGTFRDIPVPEESCIGAVRSIGIQGLDWKKYNYNLIIDGKELVDPYARKIVGREKWADFSRKNKDYKLQSGFDFSEYDWQCDRFPEIPANEMLMYKLHVRGFTKDGGSEGRSKGTFAGIEQKIPYLKDLGVTTLELMPIYEFEEIQPKSLPEEDMDYDGWSPQAVEGYQLLRKKEREEKEAQLPDINYWGYGEGNYFAPKASYAMTAETSVELKDLIKRLHENNLEFVMEMHFADDVNPNFIVDVLRHWVINYHVDGFHLLCRESAIDSVITDVYLRRTKIFYHRFPDYVWNQKQGHSRLFVYNDEFLYASRKMLNQMSGNLMDLLNQMKKQNANIGFVNYIANHNGFTLADLFSYSMKHNEANGEEGADGNDWNFSVNCGVEGATRKKAILELRYKRMKEAIAVLMISQGVPLLLAGDEFGNSQQGNNNAYCQDNRIGWVNWKTLNQNKEYFEEVKRMIAFRRRHPVLTKQEPFRMSDYLGYGMPDLSYHDAKAWTGEIYPSMQAVGILYCGAYGGEEKHLYIGLNFSSGAVKLALPTVGTQIEWELISSGAVLKGSQVEVDGESVIVLQGTVVPQKDKIACTKKQSKKKKEQPQDVIPKSDETLSNGQ